MELALNKFEQKTTFFCLCCFNVLGSQNAHPSTEWVGRVYSFANIRHHRWVDTDESQIRRRRSVFFTDLHDSPWMTHFKVKTANFAERWQVCTPGKVPYTIKVHKRGKNISKIIHVDYFTDLLAMFLDLDLVRILVVYEGSESSQIPSKIS